MAIRSAGADQEFDGDAYSSGPFLGTRYELDTVWAGGYFIAWPAGGVTSDDADSAGSSSGSSSSGSSSSGSSSPGSS